MPKVRDTKKQKARELLRRVTDGPAFSEPLDGTPFTPGKAIALYRLWASTWVIPDILELVPQLRSGK